jgi:hypothetical protein
MRSRSTDRALGSGDLPTTTDLLSTRPTHVPSMASVAGTAWFSAADASRAELNQTFGRLCGRSGIAVMTAKSEPRTE